MAFAGPDGEVRGGVLVLSDISAQVTAEKDLLQGVEKQMQSQKMEAWVPEGRIWIRSSPTW